MPYTYSEALNSMAELYRSELDALAGAGLTPAMECTGGGCYVIACRFADGTVSYIGSDDGLLARFDEEPRPLEAILYPSDEAAGSGDPCQTIYTQPGDLPAGARIAPLVAAISAQARRADDRLRARRSGFAAMALAFENAYADVTDAFAQAGVTARVVATGGNYHAISIEMPGDAEVIIFDPCREGLNAPGEPRLGWEAIYRVDLELSERDEVIWSDPRGSARMNEMVQAVIAFINSRPN